MVRQISWTVLQDLSNNKFVYVIMKISTLGTFLQGKCFLVLILCSLFDLSNRLLKKNYKNGNEIAVSHIQVQL